MRLHEMFALRSVDDDRWEMLAPNPETPYGPAWRRVDRSDTAGFLPRVIYLLPESKRIESIRERPDVHVRLQL